MMNRIRTRILAGVSLMAMLATNGCSSDSAWSPHNIAQQIIMATAYQAFVNEQKHNYVISGTVRDESGTLLDDVQMEVSYTDVTKGIDSPDVIKKFIVDSRNPIRLHTYNTGNVCMDFYKTGYNFERKQFNRNTPGRTKTSGRTIHFEDIVVEMVKVNNPQKMIRYTVFLEQNTDGSMKTQRMIFTPHNDTMEINKEEHKCTNSNIPNNVLYAYIDHTMNIHNIYSGGPQQFKYPNKGIITIGYSGTSDDGFVRIPIEIGQEQYVNTRYLREAPVSGYNNTMEISTDDYDYMKYGPVGMREISPGSGRIPFYCKLNGVYGKGCFNTISYWPDKGLYITIELLMQTVPGERNLEQTW